jgi:hypothetical protein
MLKLRPDGHSDGHSRLESVLLMLKPSSRIEVLLSHVCVNVNSSVRLRRESSMYFVSGECHSFFRRSRLCSLVHYKAGAGWRRMQSIHTRRTYRGRCGQNMSTLTRRQIDIFLINSRTKKRRKRVTDTAKIEAGVAKPYGLAATISRLRL